MEKEQSTKTEEKINNKTEGSEKSKNSPKEKEIEVTPEDKIKELEDKLTRTFAEMEKSKKKV